jgi:hypothetical protein
MKYEVTVHKGANRVSRYVFRGPDAAQEAFDKANQIDARPYRGL